MQERRFNFVRRKSPVKFDFIAREARVTAAPAMPRGVVAAVRGTLLSLAVLLAFVFSANLVVRYFFENVDIKGLALDISPFAKPKYFISKGNMFTVYGNGNVELVSKNMDSLSLPFITGVEPNEKRAGHKKALKMALAINSRYLRDISEINLSNPGNIIIITVGGAKIYTGNDLSNEQMENYHITLERVTKRFSVVDLRYKDRVIIK